MTERRNPNRQISGSRTVTAERIWPDAAMLAMAEAVHLLDGRSWSERAACRRADWRLFEPAQGNEVAGPPRRAVRAARYCVDCPVLDRCRARAEETQSQGVWAGAWRTGSGGKHTVRPIPVPRDDAA